MIGQDMLNRTRRERERAEALLSHLVEAKAESERNLALSQERDPLKQATGRSAFDNAIAATRGMIESLDRTCADALRPATTLVSGVSASNGVGRDARMGALVGTVA